MSIKESLVASCAVAMLLAFQSVCAESAGAKVLIGGTGQEPHINSLIDGIADQLSQAGLTVKTVPAEAKSRLAAMESLRASDADSLVYVSLNMATPGPFFAADKAKIQCISKDGKQLWEEEISGGAMAVNSDSSIKNMLKSVVKKLQPHIGQAGLAGKQG